MKKTIIFGAGQYGKDALEKLGEECVAGFIDNNPEKQRQLFCGKPVMSVEQALAMNLHIWIASEYSSSMERQLKDYGAKDYSIFLNHFHKYYETDSLVFNPYETIKEVETEEEWNNSDRFRYTRRSVYDEVEKLYKDTPLFEAVEVETINRCNGNCSFCPVNQKVDPRVRTVMAEDLFREIICQLEELNYSGRFSVFSNNEPLLDERIVELNQYAREHLPNAVIHMFTNGTLFTLDKFIALADVLDELIIDNYHQELKLIKPCLEIQEYCKTHPELTKKVTIVLRKPKEILTSRGGTAPNRKQLIDYGKDRCVLPFKQMIIRPDGKVSLCCNDAVGRYTLGDLNQEKMLDVWYGPRFQEVRKSLYEGRERWGECKYCDTFYL